MLSMLSTKLAVKVENSGAAEDNLNSNGNRFAPTLDTPIRGDMPKPSHLFSLLVLNALPLIGVIAWDWQSFDLIFLYWLENLIIGAFTLLRMLIRPYRHATDFVVALFFAPFFTFHYGMFCLAHGSFVFALFGPEDLDIQGFAGALLQIWPTLEGNHLGWAASSLLLLQLVDWWRDVRRHGLGFDGIKVLMLAPYRRIIVLHVAILGSGFVLTALDEPVLGLAILVLLKIAFDVYHWKKDEQHGEDAPATGVQLTPQKLAEMRARFAEPEIEVNGRKIRFNSFHELKQSSHFRMLAGIMRLFGRSGEYRLIETFLDMKIAEENGESPFDLPTDKII